MPKYIIKEGVLNKMIHFIFAMIADGKAKALETRFKSDPELISMTKELDVLRTRIKRRFTELETNPITSKHLDQPED